MSKRKGAHELSEVRARSIALSPVTLILINSQEQLLFDLFLSFHRSLLLSRASLTLPYTF
jgi:hypothetical protein